MPFQFPLAKVLLVRESVKKQEERALQKIVFDMLRVAHEIENLTAEIAEAHNAVERVLQQPIPAIEVQSLIGTAQTAAEDRTILVRELQTLEENRERQLAAYHAAHRNCEVLIDLLDKQRDAYEQEHERIEQKQQDDIFVARRPRS